MKYRQHLFGKPIVGLLFLFGLMSINRVASAAVLTFDDIAIDKSGFPSYVTPIANGYGGLNWNNFEASAPVLTYNNGYVHGIVSGDQVAFNNYGNLAAVSSSQFDFNGTYLTAAWRNGLHVTVSGSLDGTLLYSQTITVDTYGPTWFAFNYVGIDSLSFTSFGGTNAGLIGADGSGGTVIGDGTQFAMDNFTFTQAAPVPVPAAAWLFGSGLVGLIGVARRKAAYE